MLMPGVKYGATAERAEGGKLVGAGGSNCARWAQNFSENGL